MNTNLEKSNIELNTSEETGKEVISLDAGLPTASIDGTVLLSYTCFYCEESFKSNEEHSCKERIGQRFIRLEKEIESLKLENKQLRKEMKWL